MKTDEIVKMTRQQVADLVRSRQPDLQGFDGKERRRATRWAFPGTVEIREIGTSDRQVWFASCLNVSEGGMGFKSDREFKAGTQLDISVHLPEVSFFGKATVRHCTEVEEEYIVGIQFDFED